MTVTVALLTACNQDSANQPTVLPPLTSTASPELSSGGSTPSSDKSLASASPLATAYTTATASEALRSTAGAYYKAIIHAYETLDSRDLEALTSENCAGCKQTISMVRAGARKGYTYDVGRFAITSAKSFPKPNSSSGSVVVTFQYAGHTVRNRDGKVIDRVQPLKRTQQLDIGREKGHWIVREVLGVE